MLIVVSGPSGVGKGTVIAEARHLRPDIDLSTSWTTRAPRPDEIDGTTYHFVSRKKFRDAVDAGGMLEHAEFAGNLYGTPRATVVQSMAEGKTVLLEIDVQGARQIKTAMPQALTVFIRPPSMFELASRLRQRGTEQAEEVDRRLRRAEEEISHAEEFDVQLTNTDVTETATALLDLLESSV